MYNYAQPRGISTPASRYVAVVPVPGNRSAPDVSRWLAVVDALEALRANFRHAVRIVDIDCGAGSLLLHALHHARALGFTAIEGRGVDGSPALIGRARSAAVRRSDPAIGVIFEVADMMASLQDEQEFPADILLWHGSRPGDRAREVTEALRLAGDVVIGDEKSGRTGRHVR